MMSNTCWEKKIYNCVEYIYIYTQKQKKNYFFYINYE